MKGWFMAYVDRDNQTPARKKEIKKCHENGTERMKMNRLELLELTEGKIKEAREIAANGGEGMFSPCKCCVFLLPVPKM